MLYACSSSLLGSRLTLIWGEICKPRAHRKICKLLLSFRYRATYFIRFVKREECSLDLSKFIQRVKNMTVSKGISHPVYYGDQGTHLSGGSKAPELLFRQTQKINFYVDGMTGHREDNMPCACPYYSLVQTFPKAFHSDLLWREQLLFCGYTL